MYARTGCFLFALGVATLALGVPTPPSAWAAAAAATAKHFASPEDAVQALVAAVKSGDSKAILGVLGPEAKPIIASGDAVADTEARDGFVASYEEANSLDKSDDSKVVLLTGKDQWPLPIPIVKDDAGWRFDTAAGDDEILARRIGRNELSAIQASLAFVDAQREYYERNPNGSKLLHYAQRILSTAGKRDGLYFATAADEDPSPLGEAFAKAKAEGYKKGEAGKPIPFHGYYFRILKAQGAHADGGAYDYLAKGELIGGFALVAYPATWASSGVMTFLVNQDGVIFEKDLGPKTATVAAAIAKFDPDETWTRVPDQDEAPEVVEASQ